MNIMKIVMKKVKTKNQKRSIDLVEQQELRQLKRNQNMLMHSMKIRKKNGLTQNQKMKGQLKRRVVVKKKSSQKVIQIGQVQENLVKLNQLVKKRQPVVNQHVVELKRSNQIVKKTKKWN